MKKTTKTALISLLSTLVVMAMMFAMTGCNSSNDKTAETKATTASTAATQAQTEKATTAETQAETQKATTAEKQDKAQDSQNSDNKLAISDVRGTWVLENAPNNCSVEVVNKAGNTIDIVITASNEGATKIATAKASLDIICNGDLIDENGFSDGTGTFEYKDSFDNTGTGSIYVNSSVITIALTEDYNSGRGWGVAPSANGKYVFYSNDVHSSF